MCVCEAETDVTLRIIPAGKKNCGFSDFLVEAGKSVGRIDSFPAQPGETVAVIFDKCIADAWELRFPSSFPIRYGYLI